MQVYCIKAEIWIRQQHFAFRFKTLKKPIQNFTVFSPERKTNVFSLIKSFIMCQSGAMRTINNARNSSAQPAKNTWALMTLIIISGELF